MRHDHFTMLPERAFRSLGGRLLTLEGGGKGGSAPPPPDYRGAAQEQAASSKETTAMQTWANRPSLETPWGKMDWTTGQTTDPGTGLPVTSWGGKLELTPDQQAALDAQQRIQAGRSAAAETLLGQATSGFEKPADWGALPGLKTLEGVGYDPAQARGRAEKALFEKQMGMIEPALTRSEDARRTRLANMGILPEGGSSAWTRAQEGMDVARQRAMEQAALSSIAGGGAEATRELGLATGAMGAENQARQQAIAEMAQQRGMSLNELNALLTGQQVQTPQMPSFSQAQAAQPLQALKAAELGGDYALGQEKLNQAGATDWGSLVGGAAKLGGALGLFSDRRLKSNIRRIGTHRIGVGIYAYNIFGREEIGVMAQEMLGVAPERVSVHSSGYLMVDYRGL